MELHWYIRKAPLRSYPLRSRLTAQALDTCEWLVAGRAVASGFQWTRSDYDVICPALDAGGNETSGQSGLMQLPIGAFIS